MERRQFLTTAGAAFTATVTGAAVVGSESAAAATVPPYVTTREQFDDDGELKPGYTATEYDTVGTIPGFDGYAGDVTVMIHGWSKSGDDPEAAARDRFAKTKTRLENAGYDGEVIGFSWDNDVGGGLDFGWSEAQKAAQANGLKLAQFAYDWQSSGNGDVRFTSHSLGAQVLFSALRTLDGSSLWNGAGYEVRTVHPFGAATDNETPTDEDGDTYDAVANQVAAAHNYHSEADDVLQWVYNTVEFDQALGETGAEAGNSVPSNYSDHDRTDSVGDDHGTYLEHIAPQLVGHMI
jgi:hypothetical protein